MDSKQNDFNNGTMLGKKLIKRSLSELGCARSVVADKNGNIICGRHVFDIAMQLGKKVLVVKTDPNTLVVVQRNDVDADSKLGRELSLVDNLTQEKNLNWDANKLILSMNKDLAFDPRSWHGHSALVKELDIQDFFDENLPVSKKVEKTVNTEHIQLSIFEQI